MRVRRRKQGQEGNRLSARLANASPNLNPIMVFVMSLFATMANDRVQQTNGASTSNLPSACLSPIDFQVALRCRKCDKDNRGNGGAAPGTDPAQGNDPRAEPSPPQKNQLEKNI
jgi:hypothetical protein